MNNLQRKIKRLNENTKRLLYEVVQADLTKTLTNLIINDLIKNKDYNHFKQAWESALRGGMDGFKPYKGSVSVNRNKLADFLNNTIKSAAGYVKDANVGYNNIEDVLKFLRSIRHLINLKDSVTIANNVLDSYEKQQQNPNLNFQQSLAAVKAGR